MNNSYLVFFNADRNGVRNTDRMVIHSWQIEGIVDIQGIEREILETTQRGSFPAESVTMIGIQMLPIGLPAPSV